jgi:transcriptional regulator with XRE-family HTH domain
MRGMNQVDLAEASVVAQNTISEIELGKRAARPGTLKKLADALGVEIADLLSGDTERPLADALPLQDRLFNGGSKERGAFIERWRRNAEAKTAHYDNRLAVVKRGGLFPGFGGAKTLQDDAFEDFSGFCDLSNGELAERWLGDPEVPDAVKEELGFALTEVQKIFLQVVGRIGDAVKELAETPAQMEEVKQRDEQLRERTRDISKSA